MNRAVLLVLLLITTGCADTEKIRNYDSQGKLITYEAPVLVVDGFYKGCRGRVVKQDWAASSRDTRVLVQLVEPEEASYNYQYIHQDFLLVEEK